MGNMNLGGGMGGMNMQMMNNPYQSQSPYGQQPQQQFQNNPYGNNPYAMQQANPYATMQQQQQQVCRGSLRYQKKTESLDKSSINIDIYTAFGP